MRLILLGAPGAGKGTQAEILSKRLGIPTISTGNILREAIRNRTETGLKAKAFMDQGKLVPDEVIMASSGTAWPSRIVQMGISSTVCPVRSRRPRPL